MKIARWAPLVHEKSEVWRPASAPTSWSQARAEAEKRIDRGQRARVVEMTPREWNRRLRGKR